MLFFIPEEILITGLYIPNENYFILPDFFAGDGDGADIQQYDIIVES
jgi:hypothetical protein